MRTLLLLFSLSAFAQSYHGHGYAHVSTAGDNASLGSTIGFGAGGEGFLYKGLALNGELNYLAPPGAMPNGAGMLATGGAYHFRKSQRLVPFVNAGYSMAFRSGVAHFAHYGGGLSFWLNRHLGLRSELRLYSPLTADFRGVATEFRFGVTFR